jgi:hypothetical protein
VRARGSRGADGIGCRPDWNSSPSLARGEDDPDRRDPPAREREREQAARGDWAGGERAGRAWGREGKRLTGLGRTGREEKEEAGRAGPCGKRGRGEKSSGWAGPQGGKIVEKRKGGSGPGLIRKRGRKRIAFKCI